MTIAKGRQKSQGRPIHRHNRNVVAISAVACVDVACAGAASLGGNLFIGAIRDCRFTFGAAEAPGVLAR
jgi:hypothetical protein